MGGCFRGLCPGIGSFFIFGSKKSILYWCNLKILKFQEILATFGPVAAILDSPDINLAGKKSFSKTCLKSHFKVLLTKNLTSEQSKLCKGLKMALNPL